VIRAASVFAVAMGMVACWPEPDDTDDGPVPDAAPPFTVTGIAPGEIFEGVGSGGSRPALIEILGTGFRGGVEVVGPGEVGSLEEPSVNQCVHGRDGDRVLALVTVPAMPELAEGQRRRIALTVRQNGLSRTVELDIVGLDELVPEAPVERFDVATLRPLYSFARLSHPIHFVGDMPARIHATSDIEISAALDVDADKQTPGPHGCPGGDLGEPGGCGIGGGAPTAVDGATGGGGGFGDIGEPGRLGTVPGGAPVGDPMLSRIAYGPGEEGNRGSGGGGGPVAPELRGSAGGGGGGTIEIRAGGTITIEPGGEVRSRGGNGGDGRSTGGGGSGGAILVRGERGVLSKEPWVSAPGGGPGGISLFPGGGGSFGRIRIDSQFLIDGMVSDGEAARGPVWHELSPQLAAGSDVALVIAGAPGGRHRLIVNDEPGDELIIGVDGTFSARPALRVGRNRVCVAAGADRAVERRSENETCLDVGYAGR
jgi:hypothetical protein